jgi:hypothetical protein
MEETIANRVHLKALAKTTTLAFDIKECKDELKWHTGNGPLTTEQLEICLRHTEREYDICNYILKITSNEKN